MESADLFESLLEYAGSYFRLRNYAEATRRATWRTNSYFFDS